jgi:hypothetical protein
MRRLIDLLPASNTAESPEIDCYQSVTEHDMSLDRLIPDNANKPYDIKELILKTIDEGDFFEIQASFAKNIVTGFGRVEGRTVGFVANQPMVLAGVLDSDASPQGCAVRALLRLLQHSDRHLRRRARLPARHGARVWRADQARREAAVRLCRSDRAESHRHHPQGLWRRL